MTTRQKLKDLGLGYKEIAGFFNLSPDSFKNSSARDRYENAILRAIEHQKTTIR